MVHKQHKRISIRVNLIIRILLFITPIILALFVSNMLAIHIITQRVVDLNFNTLTLYMENMEDRLKDVDRAMYNLMVLDPNVEELERSTDGNRANLCVTALNRTLYEDLVTYSTIEGIFVYVDRWDICANAKTAYQFYLDQKEFKSYVRLMHQSTDYSTSIYSHNGWHLARIGGIEFLLGDISSPNVHIGAYISADAYLRELRTHSRNQFDYLYFEDAEGESWGVQRPENMEDYLEIRVPDGNDMYALVGLVRRDAMLVGLARWQRVIMIAAIVLAVLLVAFVLGYLRRAVVLPVGEFTGAMQKVRDGDLTVRLEPRSRFQEFYVMGKCFNEMVTEIDHLKISVYEEQLKKQKAELHFLQLQSSPHYYLNSLNVLYSLAIQQNIPLLKKMILILSKQSRYMLKSADAKVCLRDELDHVNDYVLIQKERLSYPVEFKLDADESVMDALFPPLLIQTFVENSFKYGISSDRVLRITVSVVRTAWRGGEAMRIVVCDEGRGFSDEVLKALRKGDTVIDSLGNEHYGIENIKQRLELVYGQRISLTISNRETGGAWTEILVPLEGGENPHEVGNRG